MNDLENCFNRKLLRPVEPSKEKSELSIKQAREWLDEGKRNLENEAYRYRYQLILLYFILQDKFCLEMELEKRVIIV